MPERNESLARTDRDRELRRVLSFPKTRRALADRQLQRPYPKLDRATRRNVRRVFLFGLLHPDAMHYAIWGINDAGESALK